MIIKCQVLVSSLLLNISKAALSRVYSNRWLNQQDVVKGTSAEERGTEVCGHRIEKLTHLQTKGGPSINENTPIFRLFTTEID